MTTDKGNYAFEYDKEGTVDGQNRGVTTSLDFRSGKSSQMDAAKAALAKFGPMA